MRSRVTDLLGVDLPIVQAPIDRMRAIGPRAIAERIT